MLTKIQYYYCEGAPQEKDIKKAIQITKRDNCHVIIKYKMFGYKYQTFIKIGSTFEQIWNDRIKVYGM